MRLTDCFIEIMAYVTYCFKGEETRNFSFEQVDTDLTKLIVHSEEICDREGINREDYDLGRFAVFSWADEMILSSSWTEKNKWLGVQLQRKYYNTTDAGEIFFNKLNMIGPHQRDVREVYYLCLCAGFTGQYCNEGDEFLLEQLRNSNLKLLSGSSLGLPSIDHHLFSEAYPPLNETDSTGYTPNRFSLFTLMGIGGPLLFFGVLFLIYRFILYNVGQGLINTVL